MLWTVVRFALKHDSFGFWHSCLANKANDAFSVLLIRHISMSIRWPFREHKPNVESDVRRVYIIFKWSKTFIVCTRGDSIKQPIFTCGDKCHFFFSNLKYASPRAMKGSKKLHGYVFLMYSLMVLEQNIFVYSVQTGIVLAVSRVWTATFNMIGQIHEKRHTESPG